MAGTTGLSSLSGPAALVLLLPMEAGIPVPLPADLVMFTVGERVGAGKIPLWLAVTGFEVVAVAGTATLFLACRGPAQRLIARFGPRIGLTKARLGRATALAESRGRPGLAVGRATPGLRTLTVIAAAVSGLSVRRALPALILGSSVFLQVHLVLGLLLGPLADRAFNQAKGPAIGLAAVLVTGTVAFWLFRRRRRGVSAAWTEASCPVCVGVTFLSDRIPALAGLGDLAAIPALETADAAPEGVTRQGTG